MKIHAKLLMSLLCTALVPLLLVAGITYAGVRSVLIRNAEEALIFDARTLGNRAISTLQTASEEVRSWGQIETLQSVFTGDDVDLRMGLLLKGLLETSDFLEIWCVDASGKIIASSDFEKIGELHASLPAVAGALDNRPFISSVTQRSLEAEGDGRVWCIEYGHPIYAAFDEETIIGAVVAFYDWEVILDLVTNQNLAHGRGNQEVLLMDESHRVVAAVDRRRILSHTIEITPSTGTSLEDTSTGVEQVTTAPNARMIRGLSVAREEELGLELIAMASIEKSVVLESLRPIEISFLTTCILAVGAVIMISLALSRRISAPIVRLSHAARRIAAGELDVKPEHSSSDEIGRLAMDLDAMRGNLKYQIETLDTAVHDRTQALEESIEQLQREIHEREEAQRTAEVRQQQLLQADKMVSLGIVVSGVAHEINNPNGLIGLNLPVMTAAWEKALPVLEEYYEEHGDFSLGAMSFSEMREHIPRILSEMQQSSGRIKSIVSDLKTFSRKEAGNDYIPININDVVESASALVRNHIEEATENFTSDCTGELPLVSGDYQRLQQVVVNLLLNAADALGNRTKAIHVRTALSPNGQAVYVEVEDEGCGIEAKDLTHVTDPFFTTKRASGGTGLGLSVSAGIVKEHHGELTFESTPGKGTHVIISIPVACEVKGDQE